MNPYQMLPLYDQSNLEAYNQYGVASPGPHVRTPLRAHQRKALWSARLLMAMMPGPSPQSPGWLLSDLRLAMPSAVRRDGLPRRELLLAQHARQGRGKWMVDDGTWARIETAVVASYDDVSAALDDVDALPAAAKLVRGSVEELQSMLCALGLR